MNNSSSRLRRSGTSWLARAFGTNNSSSRLRRSGTSWLARAFGTNKLTVTALAAACVLFSNLALADGNGYVESQDGKDQNVVFKDDPLAAGGFGPKDIRIMVMPKPPRVMLVRPRTQFVTEMLKSVEAL